jgi:uncharacterized membrane-anchored protein
LFWIRIIVSTAAGTMAARFLSANLGASLGMSASTAIIGLAGAAVLLWQLCLSRNVPGVYWLAVVLVVVLGDMISSDLVDNLAVNPWVVSGALCAALLVAISVWRESGLTASAHVAATRRRETSYWSVVLCAVSLATSIDGLASRQLNLGHAASGLLVSGVMAVLASAHLGRELSSAAALGAAYVVACLTGAALGHLVTTILANGGGGLGRNAPSAVLLAILLGMVGVLAARTHRTARKRSGAREVSIPTPMS